MHDDSALWYDYAEPDVAPSWTLLAVANLFGLIAKGVEAVVWGYWLPEQIWCRMADALAIGTRRS